MATFYVLPPRACLEDSLTGMFGKLLPGLPLPVDAWDAVIDCLASNAGWPADVFLIPRDDLNPSESVLESLALDFGAEPGDRVIELKTSGPHFTTVGAGVSGLAAAR